MMNGLSIGINLLVMVILIVILYIMQRKHVSFTKRVFTGLGLGIVFGAVLQYIFGSASDVIKTSNDWFSLIGSGYVKLLQMVVIPLIMVSIISAIVNLKSSKGLGKISALIIGILVFTTAIAASVGISSALGFGLKAVQIEQGDKETARGEYLNTKVEDVKDLTIPKQILELLPSNPFADMTGARSTSTIAVVIFSALIGVAARGIAKKKPEEAELFTKIVASVYAVVMRIVTIILRLTPYGILALMTKVMSTTKYEEITKLGTFVIASYVALIVMFVIHLIIIALSGLNPIKYVKKSLPVLTFAFTSRTSAGAIPLNIETQTKKLGVSEGIANFAASFGASIGQNGCAGIYPAMLAVMIAPTVGVDPFSFQFIASLIAIVAISSFGVAGVGGGATFAALIVLSSMNLPVALAGLLISVEPLIDMGRTALNVSGSMTAGLLTGKLTKELDVATYNNMDIAEENPEVQPA